jgi:hypothetical protein
MSRPQMSPYAARNHLPSTMPRMDPHRQMPPNSPATASGAGYQPMCLLALRIAAGSRGIGASGDSPIRRSRNRRTVASEDRRLHHASPLSPRIQAGTSTMALLSIRMLGAPLGLPIAALHLRLTTHDSRLTTHDSRLSTHDSQLSTLEPRASTRDSRLMIPESRLATRDPRFTAHGSPATTLDRHIRRLP